MGSQTHLSIDEIIKPLPPYLEMYHGQTLPCLHGEVGHAVICDNDGQGVCATNHNLKTSIMGKHSFASNMSGLRHTQLPDS